MRRSRDTGARQTRKNHQDELWDRLLFLEGVPKVYNRIDTSKTIYAYRCLQDASETKHCGWPEHGNCALAKGTYLCRLTASTPNNSFTSRQDSGRLPIW
jgi:hypothetical protein